MRYTSVLKGAASSSGNMQLLSSRRNSNTSQRNKQTKLYQLGTPPAFGNAPGGAGAGGTPSFGQGATSFGGKAPQDGGFGQQQSQSGFGKSPQGGGFGQPQQQSGFGKSPAGGGFGQPQGG